MCLYKNRKRLPVLLKKAQTSHTQMLISIVKTLNLGKKKKVLGGNYTFPLCLWDENVLPCLLQKLRFLYLKHKLQWVDSYQKGEKRRGYLITVWMKNLESFLYTSKTFKPSEQVNLTYFIYQKQFESNCSIMNSEFKNPSRFLRGSPRYESLSMSPVSCL